MGIGFFAQYDLVDEVTATISRAGIAMGDFVLQVMMTRKNFLGDPNVLMFRDKIMPVVVEGCCPCC